MVGHPSLRPIFLSTVLLVLFICSNFQPITVLISSKEGNASAVVADDFTKDKKTSDQAILHLRAPSMRDTAGISVPSDGVAVSGGFTLQAVEWTSEGALEHNTTEDFASASTTEHIVVENGTARLEDQGAQVTLSGLNSWGNGQGQNLVLEGNLSLLQAPGIAFEWDRVLTNASNEQENVVLKVDTGGITHAVYEDNSKGLDVYYARSFDGFHFTDFKYLDTTNNRFYPQKSPDLAIGPDDVVHIVYADGRTTPDDFDIYYTKSMDHGAHFTTESRVDHGGTAYQTEPALALDADGGIHIVWEDKRDGNSTIYYSKDFGTEFRVSQSTKGYQSMPDIAIDTNGTVHVVWRDNRTGKSDWKIYHAILPKGESAFRNESKVNTGTLGTQQYFPTIEPGDNGRIYSAWSDDRALEYNLYLSKCDNGVNFTTPVRVTPILVQALAPSLSYRDGVLHLAWYDYRDDSNGNIYYTNTTDGTSFKPTARVDHSNGSVRARSPSVAVGADGDPRIAWVDFRQHSSGDLFATKGTINHVSNGTLVAWMDLGTRPHAFTLTELIGQFPVGTKANLTGWTSPDNVTWSSAVDLVNDTSRLVPDRYLKVQILLTSSNTALTPEVAQVRIDYRKYVQSGTLISELLMTEYPVSKIKTEWGWSSIEEGLKVSVSLNGGLSWTQVTNGALLEFPTTGSELVYKVEFARGVLGTPLLDWIDLVYTQQSFPKDLKVTVGDAEVWRYTGQFTSEASITGISKAVNDYLGSIPAGSDEENITIPIEVTSTQIGDLVLKGLSLDIALPPKITGSGPGSEPEAEEGQNIIFWVSVSELDARPLTYEWFADGNLLEGQGNYTTTYKVSYEPSAPRTEVISVRVSNGYRMVQKSWDLTVQPSNRPPVIESGLPEMGSILVDKVTKDVYFSVTATDPDGDVLDYTWIVDGTQQGSNDKEFQLETQKQSKGEHLVSVEVSDGTTHVTKEWTVLILPDDGGGDGDDDGANTIALYAIMAFIIIILCGIAFVESFRRARGGRRALRKRQIVTEEKKPRPKASEPKKVNISGTGPARKKMKRRSS